MLLSRSLARRRIAAGRRPGWLAAWLPVLFDTACIITPYMLLWVPFREWTIQFNFPLWASIAALFALFFIPLQGVVIISSLWATRSRWIDDAGNNS